MPLSRWNRNRQVITAANAGSAYGTRNRVRSTPRPTVVFCSDTAAAVPMSHDAAITISVKHSVTRKELSSDAPTGWSTSSTTSKLPNPAHGASHQRASWYWVSFSVLISSPASIGPKWTASSSISAGSRKKYGLHVRFARAGRTGGSSTVLVRVWVLIRPTPPCPPAP